MRVSDAGVIAIQSYGELKTMHLQMLKAEPTAWIPRCLRILLVSGAVLGATSCRDSTATVPPEAQLAPEPGAVLAAELRSLRDSLLAFSVFLPRPSVAINALEVAASVVESLNGAGLVPVRVGSKVDTLYVVGYHPELTPAQCQATVDERSTRPNECPDMLSLFGWSRNGISRRMMIVYALAGGGRISPYSSNQVLLQWLDASNPHVVVGISGAASLRLVEQQQSCGKLVFPGQKLSASCTRVSITIDGQVDLGPDVLLNERVTVDTIKLGIGPIRVPAAVARFDSIPPRG